jgi:hypothetical protein
LILSFVYCVLEIFNKEHLMSIAEISKQFHADKRGNCAMAVAYGYARATGKSEVDAVASAEMFRNFGGGKAPNGSCGALYAAKMMQPDHADAIEDFFKRGAQNFTKCSEIRPNKIIPCNRCVELAGEALDFLEK